MSENLNPLPGIHVQSIPRATDGEFGFVHNYRGSSVEDYLGRSVLSIESISSPTFFRPIEEGNSNIVKAKFVSDIGMEKVCQALALESDHSVEMAFQWNDYGEVSLYLGSERGSYWSANLGGMAPRGIGFTLHTDFKTGVKSLSINEEKIARISEITMGDIISRIAKQKQEEINVAISRWCKSKESFRTLGDQFIDLRIALESLYLRNIDSKYRGEMRFRLALCGAWHLGADVAKRKTILKTLRDAYDMASSAVHGGNVDYTEASRRLLAEGQRLCQLGILKLLEEGVRDDWSALILGADDGTVKGDRNG